MVSEVRPETPLDRLLGGKAAAKLEKEFGICSAVELLEHHPRRYIEYGQLSSFADLREEEHVTFIAQVVDVSERRMQRRRGILVEVTVEDSLGGRLRMAFFQGWNARRQLLPGVRAMFHGKVGSYAGQLTLNNPEFTVLSGQEQDAEQGRDEEAVRLGEGSAPVPLYPAKAGLSSWEIHRCVQILLDLTDLSTWPDPLPEQVRAAEELPGLAEAYRMVHRPEEMGEAEQGFRRMRFQEAFLLQALLTCRRQQVRQSPARPRPLPEQDTGLLASFDAQLPFTLTPGQVSCGALISHDLAGEAPMNRLLQGEVGSGKTLVALRAMLQVVDAGGQAALIAPTEVLAAQHERSLRRMLGGLPGVTMTLLTGSMSAAERKGALLDIASGTAGLVVGTHAVLGEQVQFADLGLVVVDEQHRFGVEQRDALRAKAGGVPHLLVMTATPIPRTVAMTVFGDLETSVLREVPAGRADVVTHVVPAGNQVWVDRTWARVREEVDGGGRAYVVAPRIDATEGRAAKDDGDGADLVLDDVEAGAPDGTEAPRVLRAVSEVAEELRSSAALRGVAVGVLHGRMTPEDKERALADFASGAVPVLVSTTVVEVGVDVPEATAMVVLDADRFGVSQLHQLRGRIGRGSRPGVCLLVADAPEGTPAQTRLGTLAGTRDGFELAAVDLELRREGDVLGAAQSGGTTSLRLLRVARDADVIAEAREDARALVDVDPELRTVPLLDAAIQAVLAGERDEFIDRT